MHSNSSLVWRAATPPYATFWQRFGAIWVDVLVFLPIVVAAVYAQSNSKNVAFAWAIVGPAIHCAYDIYFHARFGQTIGKRAMKIRVVRTDGGPIGWREAWLRSSVNVLLAAFACVGSTVALSLISDADYYGADWMDRARKLHELQPPWLVWSERATTVWVWSEVAVMLMNRRRRALHDFLAGTIVISDRPD
jgi:uncharacterized RDD family membrane protein YckC